MIKLHINYLISFLRLLLVEILIAVFVHDHFVRPYFGDFLVVMLLYCLVKGLFEISVLKAGFMVWLFACFIEFLQYFKFADWLGLKNNSIGYTILGNSFSWSDIFIYAAGIITVLVIENLRLTWKD